MLGRPEVAKYKSQAALEKPDKCWVRYDPESECLSCFVCCPRNRCRLPRHNNKLASGTLAYNRSLTKNTFHSHASSYDGDHQVNLRHMLRNLERSSGSAGPLVEIFDAQKYVARQELTNAAWFVYFCVKNHISSNKFVKLMDANAKLKACIYSGSHHTRAYYNEMSVIFSNLIEREVAEDLKFSPCVGVASDVKDSWLDQRVCVLDRNTCKPRNRFVCLHSIVHGTAEAMYPLLLRGLTRCGALTDTGALRKWTSYTADGASVNGVQSKAHMEEQFFGRNNIVKLCNEDKQEKTGRKELMLGRWCAPHVYDLISEAPFKHHEVFQTLDTWILIICIKLHNSAKAQAKLNLLWAWVADGEENSPAKMFVGKSRFVSRFKPMSLAWDSMPAIIAYFTNEPDAESRWIIKATRSPVFWLVFPAITDALVQVRAVNVQLQKVMTGPGKLWEANKRFESWCEDRVLRTTMHNGKKGAYLTRLYLAWWNNNPLPVWEGDKCSKSRVYQAFNEKLRLVKKGTSKKIAYRYTDQPGVVREITNDITEDKFKESLFCIREFTKACVTDMRRRCSSGEVSGAFEIFDTDWDHEALDLPEPADLPQLKSIGKLLDVEPGTLVASYLDAMQARKGYMAAHPTVGTMRKWDERQVAVWPPLLQQHYAECDPSSCCDCYRAVAIMLTMQGQNTTVERDFSLMGLIQDRGEFGQPQEGPRNRS